MLWFGLFVYVHLEVYVSIVSLSASLPVIRMQKISEKKNNTSGITVNETKWTTLNCNDYSVMLNTLLKTTKIMLKRKTFTHTNTHKRTKNLCPRRIFPKLFVPSKVDLRHLNTRKLQKQLKLFYKNYVKPFLLKH